MAYRSVRWFAVLFAAMALTGAGVARADSPGPAVGVPQDVQDGFKQLKTADSDGRQKIFDLFAAKGDARIIPAIKAYRTGELILHNGQAAIYGERVDVPGQGPMLPLVDAFTRAPIPGP